MFGLIKKIFIGLFSFSRSLASMDNVSNFATFISAMNDYSYSYEYNQSLSYNQFMVTYL